MDRFPLIALLLLVATAGLAGCTDDEPDPETAPMTAQEASDLAEVEASDWAPDGEVVILTGLELPEGHELLERQDEIDAFFAPTDNVGDGVTPVWLVTAYSAEQNETRFFQVLPETTITLPEIQAPAFDPAKTLEWSVDSPEAVKTALEDDAFNQTLGEPMASLSYTLRMQQGEPLWRLSATPEPREEPVQMRVHGATGAIIEG